jgi:hypothetical protein
MGLKLTVQMGVGVKDRFRYKWKIYLFAQAGNGVVEWDDEVVENESIFVGVAYPVLLTCHL